MANNMNPWTTAHGGLSMWEHHLWNEYCNAWYLIGVSMYRTQMVKEWYIG